MAIRSWQPVIESHHLTSADPLKTIRKVAEELNVNHPIVSWHLKQIRKEKKLNKWVPHKLTANQKSLLF